MVKLQKPVAKTLNNLGVAKKSLKKDKKLKKKDPESGDEPVAKKEKLMLPTELQIKKLKREKLKKKTIAEAINAAAQSKQIGDNKQKKKKITEVAAQTKIPLVLAPPKLEQKKKKQKKVELPSTKHIESAIYTIQNKQKAKESANNEEEEKTAKKLKDNKKNKLTHAVEPEPFVEEKFDAIVNEENVEKIVNALKKVVGKEVAERKTSIFSDYRYILDVCCFKIPSCPKRMVKLNLKHSIVGADDDVLIVVTDLQRGAKVDYEPTKQHYEKLFREAGVRKLEIMPFNKLRQEYKTFEAKRKLSNTYDYFLVDGRIAGHVTGFCSKIFQKARTTFHSVHLTKEEKIHSEIEKALHRTAYREFGKGNMISIPVANDKHTSEQVAENIICVVSQLKSLFPGGLGNIRSMYVKIDRLGTSSLPIYISTNTAPEETPYIIGLREQRMLKMKHKANEVLSSFAITKDAKVVKLTKDQINRKRKMKEAREALLADRKAAAKAKSHGDDDDNDDKEEEEEEELPVPAKKIRKEKIKKHVNGMEEKKEDVLNVDADDEKLAVPTKKIQKKKAKKTIEGKQKKEEDTNGIDNDDDADKEELALPAKKLQKPKTKKHVEGKKIVEKKEQLLHKKKHAKKLNV